MPHVKGLTSKAGTGGNSHSTADGALGRSYRTRGGGTPLAGRAVWGRPTGARLWSHIARRERSLQSAVFACM